MNEREASKPDGEQGLYRKYNVERLNDPTGKHADCVYYVLDLHHDQHAIPALLAYAKSCEAQYPTLAFDLRHQAAALAMRLNVPMESLPSSAEEKPVAWRYKVHVTQQDWFYSWDRPTHIDARLTQPLYTRTQSATRVTCPECDVVFDPNWNATDRNANAE